MPLVDQNGVSCFVDQNGIRTFVDENGVRLACGAFDTPPWPHVRAAELQQPSLKLKPRAL